MAWDGWTMETWLTEDDKLTRQIVASAFVADDMCGTCGIGFRLPSGRCDHCDTVVEAYHNWSIDVEL